MILQIEIPDEDFDGIVDSHAVAMFSGDVPGEVERQGGKTEFLQRIVLINLYNRYAAYSGEVAAREAQQAASTAAYARCPVIVKQQQPIAPAAPADTPADEKARSPR